MVRIATFFAVWLAIGCGGSPCVHEEVMLFEHRLFFLGADIAQL